MPTSRHRNTGRTFLSSIHFQKRAHFPTYMYTCCSEIRNNTCAENLKIHGLKFDTLYSGAIWRRRGKFEQGCTTTIILYKMPPKHFFKNCTA